MPVILVIIFLVIGGYFVYERTSAVVSDLKVTIATSEALTEASINFNEAMPGVVKDINNDGEENITIMRLYIDGNEEDENTQSSLKTLEAQLADKGTTVLIFDKLNFDRMIKKDAFCPLNELIDVTPYGDKVMYRDNVPVALHISGSYVLKNMDFTNDDLYAMVLFRRPQDANDTELNAEYENASLMLKELMKQS